MVTNFGASSARDELRQHFGASHLSFVVSGGMPVVPSSSLTIDAFACTAIVGDSSTPPSQIPVVQSAVSITVPNSATVWIAIVTSDLGAAPAGWTRESNKRTHYVYQATGTRPADPSGGIVLSRVTVAGSIITLVENFAYRSPVDAFLGEHNVKSWGALGDSSTNDQPAIQNAINAAQVERGTVVFPTNKGFSNYNVDSVMSITQPITLVGKGVGVAGSGTGPSAHIRTDDDISIFTISRTASGSVFRNLFIDNVGSSTGAAIVYTNSNTNLMERVTVTGFSVGVRYEPGVASPQSSFLNTIRDSEIINNTSINIDAQKNTNALRLDGVTFGGGSSPTGLKVMTSNTLNLIGGDVEGTTSVAIDLDSELDIHVGHLISGTHIEGNTASNGDIRIGATNPIRGITIVGVNFIPGVSADSGVNAIQGSGISIIGGTLHSGYAGSNLTVLGFARFAAAVEKYSIVGMSNVQTDDRDSFRTPSTLIFQAASAFDANYQDGTKYNLYKIDADDIVANKNYYGDLSIIRVDVGTSPGAGAVQYALGGLISNGHGGAVNARAIKAGAALDLTSITLAYGGTISTDASRGNNFIITITNASSHTISAPTNPISGQVINYTLRNASGGAAGTASWNAVFKLAAWTQAANGFSRSITFRYDGTNWIEISRTTADIPN